MKRKSERIDEAATSATPNLSSTPKDEEELKRDES